MKLVFVDIETTGRDPDRHEMWELAYIFQDPVDGRWTTDRHWFDVSLSGAEPEALEISGWFDRVGPRPDEALPRPADPYYTARRFSAHTRGCHLVGVNPAFDEAFLRDWVDRYGSAAAWHYHTIDVKALGVGYLIGRQTWSQYPQSGPPWSTEDVARGLGVPVGSFDRHTALGDVRLAAAMYDAVIPVPGLAEAVAA